MTYFAAFLYVAAMLLANLLVSNFGPAISPVLAFFLIVLAFKSFRMLLWGPRFGHMGHHRGPWGRHWENGVPPMFEEWHKKAHGESAEDKKE